jgi:hypothetical protein
MILVVKWDVHEQTGEISTANNNTQNSKIMTYNDGSGGY